MKCGLFQKTISCDLLQPTKFSVLHCFSFPLFLCEIVQKISGDDFVFILQVQKVLFLMIINVPCPIDPVCT